MKKLELQEWRTTTTYTFKKGRNTIINGVEYASPCATFIFPTLVKPSEFYKLLKKEAKIK